MEQFRNSRAAFESMTQRISSATLNTYWDYDTPRLPTKYERRSELRFISGQADDLLSGSGRKTNTHAIFFHAPLGFVDRSLNRSADRDFKGLDNLLNTWGYFVEFSSDEAKRPSFITNAIAPPQFRFRLMEFMQTADQTSVYGFTSGLTGGNKPTPKTEAYTKTTWFSDGVEDTNANAPVHVLADNVIALVITPRLARDEERGHSNYSTSDPDFSPLAKNYTYDSTKSASDPSLNPKHQLPPLVEITMVAIDEPSAIRLGLTTNADEIFKLSGKFNDTKKFDEDMREDPNSLEKTLVKMKVSYRIFNSKIALKGGKWSREQAN